MIAPPRPWLWPWLAALGTYASALIWLFWPGRNIRPPAPPRIPRQRAVRQEARR